MEKDNLDIIILVDGSPCTTNDYACYPAVPILLKHLLNVKNKYFAR